MGAHLLPHQTEDLFLSNTLNIPKIRQGSPARNFIFKNFINSAGILRNKSEIHIIVLRNEIMELKEIFCS